MRTRRIGAKLIGGVAATALALSVGAVVAMAAVTGSSDPTVWGQTIKADVENCKDQLASGQHGIGDCVSDIAQTHGKAVSGQHKHGGNENNNAGSGNDSGGTTGDTGPDHGAKGKPDGVPVGPPASVPPGSSTSHPTGPPVTPPSHH